MTDTTEQFDALAYPPAQAAKVTGPKRRRAGNGNDVSEHARRVKCHLGLVGASPGDKFANAIPGRSNDQLNIVTPASGRHPSVMQELTKKAIKGLIWLQIITAVMLFAPAWTLRFWEAWACQLS